MSGNVLNAINEINNLNSIYEKLENAFNNHTADWMNHQVEHLSDKCASECVSEFRNKVCRINQLVRGLSCGDSNIFELPSPNNYSELMIKARNEKNQEPLARIIKDDYHSINEESIKLRNQLNIKKNGEEIFRKKSEEDSEKCCPKICNCFFWVLVFFCWVWATSKH